LPACGIDPHGAPDGHLYCREVNPSPAFAGYHSGSGKEIAEAVA
jgi:hypothetical protein